SQVVESGHNFLLKAVGGVSRSGLICSLDSQSRVALQHSLRKLWALALRPESCRMHHTVAKRPAIRAVAADNRARNTDELRPHFVRSEPNGRIAVAAKIHELQVRGKFRVRNGECALQIEA